MDDGEEIEGVLIDALGNPRERLNCLQIEDQMLTFCQSTGVTLEIPPQKNSFQKLVVKKLASRFRLQPMGYTKPHGDGENGFCFRKTEQTIIPARLLIAGDNAADRSTYSGGNAMYDGSAPPVVPAPKVMQRKISNENLNKQNSKKKVTLSEEEQERQYEEAKARIFAASSGAADSNEGPGGGSTPTPPPIEDQMQNLDINNNNSSSNNSNNNGGGNNKGAGKGGKVGGKGGRDGGKAIMKNMNDRGDPDFTRRGRGMPQSSQQPQQMNPPPGPPPGPPGMYGMPYPAPYGYQQYAMPPNYYAPPQYYMDPNAAGYPNAVPMQYAGYQQPPYPPQHMAEYMQPGMHPVKNGNGIGGQGGFVNVNGGNSNNQGQGKKKKNNNRGGNNNNNNNNNNGDSNNS